MAQLDRGSVGEHFGHALSELRRIVAHGNNGIGAALLGMLDHSIISIRSRLLANFLKRSDVAPQDARQGAANALCDRLRPYHDAPHDTEIFLDLVAFQIVPRRDSDTFGHDCLASEKMITLSGSSHF